MVEERHRHRYEVSNAYRDTLEAAGLVFSGTSPDNSLVEFVELPVEVHPYYVSTQAHPELHPRPTRPHPLFAGLVRAALERQRALRFPLDESTLRPPAADAGLVEALVGSGPAADKEGCPAHGRAGGPVRSGEHTSAHLSPI